MTDWNVSKASKAPQGPFPNLKSWQDPEPQGRPLSIGCSLRENCSLREKMGFPQGFKSAPPCKAWNEPLLSRSQVPLLPWKETNYNRKAGWEIARCFVPCLDSLTFPQQVGTSTDCCWILQTLPRCWNPLVSAAIPFSTDPGSSPELN